jgi:hypothetical protein
MSILTIMIINTAAAGILSAILAAVILAPVRHLRPSHERGGAHRTQAHQRRQVRALRPVKHASQDSRASVS